MSSRKPKNRSEVAQAAESSSPKKSGKGENVAAPDLAADGGEDSAAAVDLPVAAESEIKELSPRRRRVVTPRTSEEPGKETFAAGAAHVAAAVEAEADSEDAGEPDDPFAEPEAPKSRAHMKRVLESLIFVSDQVISAQHLGRIVKLKQAEVRELVAELSGDYEGRGVELVEVNGGFQFRSAAACAQYVGSLVAQRPTRLTRAQLETLALIAYRQPITRPEIDDVRGVDSGSALKVLTERELVKILGRKEEAGRPLLYGTTPFFLEFFGMNTMQDLPTLREFTELTVEHRELFQRKTGEVPDLSGEPAPLDLVDVASESEAAGVADVVIAEEPTAEASADEAATASESTTSETAVDAVAPVTNLDDDPDFEPWPDDDIVTEVASTEKEPVAGDPAPEDPRTARERDDAASEDAEEVA
ncbi:MAG: hypothetical protein RL701_4009 [Pseudomonadota bacterium]